MALNEMAKRLYVLDFGLFQVSGDGRLIGIAGYLIQTHDARNILVDTGFPARYVEESEAAVLEDNLGSFGEVISLTNENLPSGQLAKIGLQPSDIHTLVMTHSDIDHIGGIADFHRVPIVIGDAERALPTPRYFDDRSPIDWPENVEYQLIDEDTLLCPGVTLLTTPGHSPGHLSLLVQLAETGAVLITGDAIARPAEFEVGFGGAWDEDVARTSAERLMRIAEREQALIIYGHDPAQLDTIRKAPEFYS